ncbi:hypothetical protein PTKIN_Ptkin16aG0087500 [Pterospermum kingtungense]
MTRIFDSVEDYHESISEGIFIILCQFFVAISILSMVIFGCVDQPKEEDKEKKEEEKNKPPPPSDQVTVTCCDGGCCSAGGGDGGDGGGCGGCGGGD